jgi:hypothetical protein
MQLLKTATLITAFLFFQGVVWAQDETEIHKNLKLVEMPMMSDVFADAAKQFLPLLKDSLKEITADQSDECYLTMRVAIGVKEVGSAKIKRPVARIVAFRRNSKEEFVGDFILYSFTRSGPVNKEETILFLKKQILAPAACP